MFDEMRNAINAAETVINQMKYRKDSLTDTLSNYNDRILAGDGLTDWEESERKECATELDLINDVEKFIMKWVKSQI